jgi:hypothetical protein
MSRIYDLAAPILGIGTTVALFSVLVLLLMGRFFRFWTVLVYVAWELLATLFFTIADVLYNGSARIATGTETKAQLLYAHLYWANDVIVDLFRFVLVIVLIYMASFGSKRVSGRILVGLVVAALILPFVLFHPDYRPVEFGSVHIRMPSNAWFQSTSELLNFGAAVMNLMLWATLLASKRRDSQILMVSLGLGIVVTGTALGYGVRHLIGERDFSAIGYLFMNLTQLLGWLVWCRAFWPVAKTQAAVEASAPSP